MVKGKKPESIPIFRMKLGRVVLIVLTMNSPLLLILYINRRNATAWAQLGDYWPVALAAIAGVVLTATLGKRIVFQRTLVSGEHNCLRVTAPSTGIANPREESLTGDLTDLTMSIKILGAERPVGRFARAMKRNEFASVVFSGSAGTIGISPSLKNYKDGFEERFAEWKRTMVSLPD